ncbi:MAG: hypothetical protein VB108_09880 [Anaerolineaceae bacterium]|nr:hypothetical protein [Anaerolineaceae bacterium]
MTTHDVSEKVPAEESYSVKVHRKESFWKIIFPILLSAVFMLVFLILIVLFSERSQGGLAGAGAAAAVLVILPHFLGLLLWLAILAGLAYGVFVLKQKIPGQGEKLVSLLRKVQIGVHQASNAAAKPSIKLKSGVAQIKQIFVSLQERLR